MSRRCCCALRNCTYFDDAFDGVVSGIDESDWVVCDDSGEWEEDSSDLYEYSGNGTDASPVICMCKTPHPTKKSTVEVEVKFTVSVVGESPGVIFSADLPSPIEDGDCPTGYLYARFEYTGAVVVNGTTTYGIIEIGNTGGEIWWSYVTLDPSDITLVFKVRVNPLSGGKAQVYAYLNEANQSCMCCAQPGTGKYCGVANFSSEIVHFQQFKLTEECETNKECLENHCTLGKTCVPPTIYATISNVMCDSPGGICLDSCPNLPDGSDEGATVTMTMPRINVMSGTLGPVSYMWEGQHAFSCSDGSLATLFLNCNGEAGAIDGASCGNANRAAADFIASGSAGGTGVLISYTESPFMLSYSGLYVVVNECCITFNVVFTE